MKTTQLFATAIVAASLCFSFMSCKTRIGSPPPPELYLSILDKGEDYVTKHKIPKDSIKLFFIDHKGERIDIVNRFYIHLVPATTEYGGLPELTEISITELVSLSHGGSPLSKGNKVKDSYLKLGDRVFSLHLEVDEDVSYHLSIKSLKADGVSLPTIASSPWFIYKL